MAINIATGFNVGAPLSIDTRFILTKTEMQSMNDNLIPDIYFCLCSEDGRFYIYNKKNTVNETTGKYRVLEGGASASIQKEVLPLAAAEELNNIYQYIGEDTSEYTNAYFYKCIEDEDGNYIWKNINIQNGNSIETKISESTYIDADNNEVSCTQKEIILNDFTIVYKYIDDGTIVYTDFLIKGISLTAKDDEIIIPWES